jgi:hypothetical protein
MMAGLLIVVSIALTWLTWWAQWWLSEFLFYPKDFELPAATLWWLGFVKAHGPLAISLICSVLLIALYVRREKLNLAATVAIYNAALALYITFSLLAVILPFTHLQE